MRGAANLPGWSFLTGDPFDIETIRFRLFRGDHINFDLDLDFHASMLRIINDATNCWTTANPFASIFTILQHISWADPPKSLKERLEENKAINNPPPQIPFLFFKEMRRLNESLHVRDEKFQEY